MIIKLAQIAILACCLTASACLFGSDEDGDGDVDPADCVTTCNKDKSSCSAECDNNSCTVACDDDFTQCETDCN